MQTFNPHLLKYRKTTRSPALPLLLLALTSVSGCQLSGIQETAVTDYRLQSRDDTGAEKKATWNAPDQPSGAAANANPIGPIPNPSTQSTTQTQIHNHDTTVTRSPMKVHLSDRVSEVSPTATAAPHQEQLAQWQSPGSDQHHRQGIPVSGQILPATAQFSKPNHTLTSPSNDNQLNGQPLSPESPSSGVRSVSWLAPGQTNQSTTGDNNITVAQGPTPVVDEVTGQLDPPNVLGDPDNAIPFNIELNPTNTGRFMFGVGVNSDAGLTGQIMINERNFNYRDVPFSLRDVTQGRDFRDGGQGLRIEAMPGNLLQRYMFMFTDPYFIPDPSMNGHDISLNLSGFYFDRRYYDWDEQRLGGRVAMGFRITDDLSLALALRGEKITVHNPRVVGVPQLDRVVGNNSLYSSQLILSHDTRDIPFLPTEGHYIELGLSQTFGSFSYPRADIDLRRHFLLNERADGSGRQTLSVIMQTRFSGSNTPIYERFFAGGFSTIRGFDFRGASPVSGGVTVGGTFQFITSVEYLFPLTADDMVKGVAFCDLGTVEENIAMYADSFRVSPGFGLRISVPMLGPAPLALDFAVPIAHAPTDKIQHFSFFLGLGRG